MPPRLATLTLICVLTVLVLSTSAPAQRAVPRKLAPGVLTVIPPDPQPEETYTGPLHLREMPTVDFVPNFASPTDTLKERVKHVIYRRGIWNLEFAFKPLRLMEADVPAADGKMKRKIIWYLVYRIRNIGSALAPQPKLDDFGHTTYETQPTSSLPPDSMADRFYPTFVLEGWSQDIRTGQYDRLAYSDRVSPAVVPQIRQQEDPAIPLLNSVEISQVRLPQVAPSSSSEGVWGVAVWEGIDPRIDYVSIFVQGLTNAFRFTDGADGKRVYTHKTLQLNFWRPGDTVDEVEDTIRFGVPLVSDPVEQIQILQSYRIPGPTLQAFQFEPTTDRETHLFTIDAELDQQLESPARREMNAGNFPPLLRDKFAEIGVPIAPATVLSVFLPDNQWEFTTNVAGVPSSFRIRFQPVFWNFTRDGVDFKKRVDYLWVYR